jgi:hypothetical protein
LRNNFGVFAASALPWIIFFPLDSMGELLAGKVQAGLGDASRWLKLFNAAYSEKLGIRVFPGSLNIALDHVFDWFDARRLTNRCSIDCINQIAAVVINDMARTSMLSCFRLAGGHALRPKMGK